LQSLAVSLPPVVSLKKFKYTVLNNVYIKHKGIHMKKPFLFCLLIALTLCSYHHTSPLLIVGIRSRKTKEGYFSSKCLVCKKDSDVNMKAYSIRRWFTLFFIPALPYGKKKYYFKCTECKNYYQPTEGIDIEKILQEKEPGSEAANMATSS